MTPLNIRTDVMVEKSRHKLFKFRAKEKKIIFVLNEISIYTGMSVYVKRFGDLNLKSFVVVIVVYVESEHIYFLRIPT